MPIPTTHTERHMAYAGILTALEALKDKLLATLPEDEFDWGNMDKTADTALLRLYQVLEDLEDALDFEEED